MRRRRGANRFEIGNSGLARTLASLLGCALACAGLTACADGLSNSPPRTGLVGTTDPFESANRQAYSFNKTLRNAMLPSDSGPSVLAAAWAPVHNVLVNLREPLVFANDLAQGRECAAGASLRRFMVNSTLGVGGVFDVAKRHGIEAHENTVGQTLAVWGVPAGPYLVLPLLGPTDLRGAAGEVTEFYFDPVDFGMYRAGVASVIWPRTGLDYADKQFDAAPDLAKLERTSLDGYAALRSAYRQDQAESLKSDDCPDVLRIKN
jgi:phospholipid-binding lipoprotein MlaA